MTDEMTLAALAEVSGLPARTVRYYIARGLLEGPAKAGRGAVYTSAHAERLKQIGELQRQGHGLREIAVLLAGPPEGAASAPSAWWQHSLAADVMVWVRADAPPWRIRQVRSLVDEMAARLQGRGEESEDETK